MRRVCSPTAGRPDRGRRGLLAFALSSLVAGRANALGAASAPVRLISSSAPGGGGDAMTRAFAQGMGARLGQAVVVDNLSGASGAIAARAVLKAPPDGRTLLAASTSDVITTPLMVPGAGYTHRSFRAIARLGATPFVLVSRRSSDWSSVDEMVAAARGRPQAYAIAFSGAASLSALAVAQLTAAAGIELLRVPFQGAAPAMTAVLSGYVDLAVLPLSIVPPLVRGHALQALGVMSSVRNDLLPEVPSFRETRAAPGLRCEVWAVLLGPPGLGDDHVERLNAVVRAMLSDRAFVARRLGLGEVLAAPATPLATRDFLDDEAAAHAAVVHRVADPAAGVR